MPTSKLSRTSALAASSESIVEFQAMMRRVLSKLRLEVSMAASPAFGLVTSIILAQSLGPALRGQLSALTVWAQGAALVLFLSLDKGLLSIASQAEGAARSPLAMRLERAGRAPAKALSFAAGAGASLILGSIGVDPVLVAIGGLAAVALCRYEWSAGYAMAADNWNKYMLARVVQPGAFMIFSVLVYALLQGPVLRFTGFGLAFLGATIASCVALRGKAQRNVPRLDSADISADRSAIVRYSIRYHTTTLGSFAATRIDLLMATSLLTFTQAGIYAVAGAPASLVAGLGSAALLKSLGGFALQGRHERYLEGAVILVGCVLLALLCPIFIPLGFGREFEEAVPVAQILIGSALLQYYTQSILGTLARAGHPWRAGLPNAICSAAIALSFTITTTPLAVATAVLAGRGMATLAAMVLLSTARGEGRP